MSQDEVVQVLHHLPQATVYCPNGRVLRGEPGDRQVLEVVCEGVVVALVDGPGAPAVRSMLALLFRQHCETRAVGAEALRRYRELNVLRSLEVQLADCVTTPDAAATALAEVGRFFGADGGALLQWSVERDGLTELARLGDPPCEAGRIAQEVSDSRHGQVVPCGAGMLLCVPLSEPHRGALVLHSPKASWTPEDLTTLETVVWRFCSAVRSIELHIQRVADVGARVELERTRALEESRAKSTFLANMSHELRTPMNAILGYADLLHEEALDQPELEWVVRDLDRIRGAGKHLLGLVSNILDLAKVESGHVELYPVSTDLRALCAEVLVMVTPDAERRGNRLVAYVPEGEFVLEVDQGKLRQVLLNLLSNAIRFTYDGVVSLSVSSLDSGVQIAVADDGIGMTEEECSYVFEEFAQARRRTRAEYGGTGLGLAISKELCRVMGGELGVQSAPGLGSTFTVRLPELRRATLSASAS